MASNISISHLPSDIVLRDARTWIGRVSWSATAPADIRQAAKSFDSEMFASQLQDDVRRHAQHTSSDSRNGHLGPGAAHGGLPPTLLLEIGGPETARRQRLVELASERKAKLIDKQLKSWFKGVQSRSPISAHELLILLELLTSVGPRLSAEVFLQTWITCLSATSRLLERLQDEETLQMDADERLLFAGELPWRLGIFFRNVSGSKTLMHHGRSELRRQLLEFTDTDGTPCAALLGRLPHWLACLIRSTQTSVQTQETLWNTESSDRFRYLIAIVSTLTTADGKLACSDFEQQVIGLMVDGIQLADFERKSAPARLVRRLVRHQKDTSRGRKRIRSAHVPSVQSDWGRVAILRSHWAIDADQVTITHHETHPKLHLACLGQTVISGAWELQLQVQGRTVRGNPDWSCVCWNSDRDMDYLELQTTLGDDIRVDRQILLSRKKHFLILADSVTGPTDSRVKYTSRLPLSGDAECTPDKDTRECILETAGCRIRAFPLALQQDRLYSVDGGLTANSGRLEVTQTGQGGLYAPLVLNWAPDQRTALTTWRPLTVTQNRKILSSADSAAFRLQVADHQWLLYRRIQDFQQLQTVLGLHTGNETVIAEIGRQGQIKPLLLVES